MCLAMANNLDIICEIFSFESRKIKWRCLIGSEEISKDIPDSSDIKIQFYFGKDEQFVIHILKGHGELYHTSDKYDNELCGLGRVIIRTAPTWHPFMGSTFHEFDIPSLWEYGVQPAFPMRDALRGTLLSVGTSSISNREDLIYRIVRYKRSVGKNDLDQWLFRWLTPDGAKFANWKDDHTNNSILHQIGAVLSLDDIRGLGIDNFMGESVANLRDDELNRLIMEMLYFYRTTRIGLTLTYPGNLEQIANLKLYDVDIDDNSSLSSSDEDSFDGDEETLVVESSSIPASRINPIHLALFCNLPETIDRLHHMYPDKFARWIEETPISKYWRNGSMRPIDMAISQNQWVCAKILCECGASPDPEKIPFMLLNPPAENPDYLLLIQTMGIDAKRYLEIMGHSRLSETLFANILQGVLPQERGDQVELVKLCNSPRHWSILKTLAKLGIDRSIIDEYWVISTWHSNSEIENATKLYALREYIDDHIIAKRLTHYQDPHGPVDKNAYLAQFGSDDAHALAIYEAAFRDDA